MSAEPIPFATVEEALEKFARAGKSCWSTTKTAKMRATSRWRRKKSRPKPSISWPSTAAGWFAWR